MFAALLGQEFRSTRRGLAALAGWALLIEVASLVPAVLHIPFVGSFGQTVAMLAVIAPIPLGLVVLAMRYWRSMYGQEGYFTMSIPVRGRVLYAAKVVYALAACVVLGVVTVVGALLWMVGRAWASRTAIIETLRGTWDELSALPGSAVAVVVVGIVVSLVAYIVQVSAVLSIGAQGRFSHMGFGAPLIGMVILYVVNQVLALAAMLFIPVSIDVSGDHPGQIVWRAMWPDFVRAIRESGAQPSINVQLGPGTASGAASNPDVIGLGVVLVGIGLSIVMYIWATRTIERHTSLR